MKLYFLNGSKIEKNLTSKNIDCVSGVQDDMWRLEAKGHESDVKKRE